MNEKVSGIPFRNVPYYSRIDLCNKLDPPVPATGRNWKLVADKLGFDIYQIESFEAMQERSTMLVMAEYSKMKGNSVGQFYDVLKGIDRKDAYEIIENAIPDILKNHELHEKRSLGHSNSTAVEHTDCTNLHTSSFCHRCNTSYNDFSTKYNNNSLPNCISRCNSIPSGCSQCLPCHSRENQHSHDHSCCNYHERTHLRPPHQTLNIPAYCSGITQHSPISPKNEMCSLKMNINSLGYQEADESMEVAGCSDSESPLPLHHGLARQQFADVHYLRNALDSTWLLGAEEEVTTSEEMRVESENVNSRKLNRQVSEENNYKQPLSIHQLNAAMVISPTETSPPVTSSAQPLASLKNMANESHRFFPQRDYHQHIHNAQGNILQEDRMKMSVRQIKCEPVDYSMNCTHQSENIHGCESTRNGHFPRTALEQAPKADVVEPQSSSFPRRRGKNLSTGSSSVESVSDGRTLSKSPSLPDNMKISEYKRKKAFKDTYIFVTYAYDSEKHVKEVINLCHCIGKNGFSCTMDLFDRQISINEKTNWCMEKFYKADFILVCVTQTYRNDIVQPANSTNGHPPDQLHTKHIYNLMYDQYKRNGFRMPNFVPLLFRESDEQYIPEWLQDTVKYHWPSQWKDLLWMLTKPEERLKPLPKNRNKHSYS